MKRKVITVLSVLLLAQLTFVGAIRAQNHFAPCLPDTSNPFTPMNIFIIGATLNGVDLSAGDEIGLYKMTDIHKCIAAKTITSTLAPTQPLQIIASMDDGDGCGFMEGDTILFKIWVDSKGDSVILKREEVVFYDTQTGESLGDSVIVFKPLETAAAKLSATYPQFNLSVTISPVGGGTTEPGQGVHALDSGTIAALSATPAAGYIFDNWTGDVADPNNATTTITMDGDKSITANFSQDVVPVELTSFSAKYISEKKTVLLNWQTASEMNNYGFAIERSNNSVPGSWIQIGFVDGHGTSNVRNNYFYNDENLISEEIYYYRLKQIDTDGSYEYSGSIKVQIAIAEEYQLNQNYPNPFNPETKISFRIPESGHVKLELLNILGKIVKVMADGYYESGQHVVSLNGVELTSGMYLYRMKSGGVVSIKKMALLR